MIKLLHTLKYLVWLAKNIGPASSLRLFIFRFFAPGRAVQIVWKGTALTVRAGSPDLDVAVASLGPEFEPLRETFDPDFDGLIVDAGGYIGTAALALAQIFPRAQIVTVEPSSDNFHILSENIRSATNIFPIKAALVASTRGHTALSNRGTGQWGYTIVDNVCGPVLDEIEEVETITLEEIQAEFDDQPVGLLKLDIEGGEKELFEKAAPVLTEVYAIFVELHDRILPGCEAAFLAFSKDRIQLNFGGEKYLSVRTEANDLAPADIS